MDQLLSLTKHGKLDGIGQKAASLQWLLQHGLTVPRTFILTYSSYKAFLEDRAQFQRQLERELKAKLDVNMAYAVRSSANVEDSLAYSFAGQLASLLAVTGLDGIIQSVIEASKSDDQQERECPWRMLENMRPN